MRCDSVDAAARERVRGAAVQGRTSILYGSRRKLRLKLKFILAFLIVADGFNALFGVSMFIITENSQLDLCL